MLIRCVAVVLSILATGVVRSEPAISFRPGVGFTAIDETAGYLRAGVSLAALRTLADAKLNEAAKREGIKLKVNNVDIGAGGSSEIVRVNISANVEKGGIKVRCRTIRVDFSIPAGRIAANALDGLTIFVHGTEVACAVRGDLESVAARLLIGDVNAIARRFLEELAREAPVLVRAELAKKLAKLGGDAVAGLSLVIVQGRILPLFGENFYGLTVLLPRGVLSLARDLFVAKAPKGLGPIEDRAELERLTNALQPLLPFAQSARHKQFKYPTSTKLASDGTTVVTDEGDLALSGGLICLGGDSRGCELVEKSQDPATGQFFRSPDLVGCTQKGQGDATCKLKYDSKSQFSGDQFKGVAAYFARTRNAKAFKLWLAYIQGNTVNVPSDRYASAVGHKTCAYDVDLTCQMTSEEWATLHLVAEALEVPMSQLPGERTPFNWTPATLQWSALVNDVGYRLHLVGVQLLILKQLGLDDPAMEKAAAILAARQDSNPFYLFLHLGHDKLVAKKLLEKCDATKLASIRVNHSWTWQHDTESQRWLRDPMIWECDFVARLLLSSPGEKQEVEVTPPLPLRFDGSKD